MTHKNDTQRNVNPSAPPMEEDNDNEPQDNNQAGDYLCDPLLAYMSFASQSGASANIKRAVLGHFTPDMIFKARDALWHICDHDIIGPYKRRNKTPSRPAHDSTIDDIISALTKLDAIRCMPTIVIRADDLALIPRSHPEELNDISLLDRLNRLEARVTSLQEGLDHTMCENHNIKDMISQMPVKSHILCHHPRKFPP